MKPNYVARKSLIGVLSFWRIFWCILIIPLIVLIFRLIAAATYKIEFYDDKIITYSGVLNTTKKQSVFMGVTSTSISRSLFGRIFNYGDVLVDCVGKWDIDTTGIKDPAGLEGYLQTKIVQVPITNQFVHL